MKFSEYAKRNKIMLGIALLSFGITALWSVLGIFAREILPKGWIVSVIPVISLGIGLMLTIVALLDELLKYKSKKSS